MFDKYKNNLILSNENKVLLVSSQLSNNTKILLEKLFNLIDQGINLNNILVISINKENSENIKSSFLNKTNTSVLPYFYTFNDLFLRIIKQNLNKDVTILNESIKEEFFNSYLKNYKDIINEYTQDILFNEIIRFESSNKNINEFESVLNKNFLKFIYEEYRRFKFKNRIIDSSDFSNEVLNLFMSKRDVLDFYKKIFKYILIDEFEKCDLIQFEILKMLSENSKLFCVGHDNKTDNSNLITNFCNIFKDGKKYYLEKENKLNYSTIKVSPNRILNNTLNMENKLLVNVEEGEVICKNLVEKNKKLKYIIDDIEYFIKIGVELSDFAIIYKNNSESIILLSEFIKRKIKVNFLDSNINVFEKFYIKDIINLLLFIDNPTINNFNKIYNKITFLFTNKILNFINNYNTNTNIFHLVYENLENISLVDKKNIFIIEKIINNIKKKSLQDQMKCTLYDFGYLTYLNNINKSKLTNEENINSCIDYFYNLICEFNNIQIFHNLTSSINSIHGISFGTMNSTKGMKFKYIYMIDGNFKNKYLGNNINIIYNKEQKGKIFYIRMMKPIDRFKDLSTYFIQEKFSDESLKFICNLRNIKKNSHSKVLLYDKYKKSKVNTIDYLNIN